ncbi:Fic family protein [Flavobacterium psychrophilum]|uniref:Fic family protein n=1 Tax=Flavobacterium psychrophilum TaxID=96345 RepID=UPI000B7C22E5|nr:Fic family protein [Flavobacterium psychrophilum]ELV7525257.1 Fic family protein [Flavobacterium psychrophilum]MCB6062478.1 Fic family protein [Flavobacterium psychrophilum]SNB43007.1 Fic family protein [Flavobacterium psychrophilum]
MENNIPIHLQEVLFASSDTAISRQLGKLEESGQIKKIAPRIYTSNFNETAEIIIRRNIFTILGKLYPGAVVSHRSALEFKPTSANQIFVTYTYTKKIELPGITIRFMEGLPAIEGDNPFSGELFVSQQERAFLENLQSSRQVGPTSKTITLPEIENKLEQIVQVKGEEGLNQFRDKAREIAEKLEMQSEFEKLNKLISALLTTKPSKILTSPMAVARALGNPYDKHRLELFEKLFVELQQQPYKDRKDVNTETNAFRNFAFFEAYFSNYIEGTIFEIEEAKSIIQTETPIPNRDEDSHDILGTYKLVSNQKEMSTTPSNSDELLNILQYRHQILLAARTSKKPGQFKDKNNRAGETHFVDHTLVRGTLIKGFDYYQALQEPFAKAAYIMFMISEIHPFLDGNGRIARVMMNAELVKANQTRIIIPTVYRDDYLGALRRLTRNDDPAVYIRMLQRAQEFSATLIANDMEVLENHLTLSNAFKEHDEAKLKIIAIP